MNGIDGYGSCGFGVYGGDGQPSRDSPRRAIGQHDLIIGLDILDHAYINGYFQHQIEQLAMKKKLVRHKGSGFYNESGSVAEMLSVDCWTPHERTGPAAYPGGEVVSHWWATAWVKGEQAGWFSPRKEPRHISTWLQISSVTWFFGKTGGYQTHVVWNIRNKITPNWAAVQEYEHIARSMSSSLASLATA